MKVLILTNTHGLSTGAQYVKAFRAIDCDVVTVGAPFQDGAYWRDALMQMRWPPTEAEADRYIELVQDMSIQPDLITDKGAGIGGALVDFDLVLRFDAYGDTPVLDGPRPKMPTAVIYSDPHTGNLRAKLDEARGYDHVFVFHKPFLQPFTDAGCQSVHWLPAAADPDIWRYLPDTIKEYDVLFVGATDPNVHKQRVKMLEHLGDDVTVKHAFGPDAATLFNQAWVVVNQSLAGDLNMRVPEALSCGATLLTDHVEGLGEAFPVHVDPYSKMEYLAQRIRTVTPSSGAVCQQWIREHHTYEHRASQILETVFGR